MPLRIMAWNIQDLRIRKLNPAPQDPNQERAAYIVNSVVQVEPAIFAVIEVETGWPAPGLNIGYVVTPTQGGPAVLDILARLRLAQPEPNHQWCVVPPLITGAGGKREGVAVFFDNAKVNFRGPHQLDNTEITRGRGARRRINTFQCSVGISPVAPPAYLAPWNTALRNEAPGGGPVGGQQRNQNQLAGKVGFEDDQGRQLFFPTSDCRSPMLTSFREVAPPNRVFNIFSVHLPPNAPEAALAVDNIVKIQEFRAAMIANEVRVVLGDFNLDARDVIGQGRLAELETSQLVRSGGGATQFRKAYTVDPTQLKRGNKASPEGNLPYLDYFDHVFRGPRSVLPSYDGIWSAHDVPLVNPVLGKVVDRVVGTPLTPPGAHQLFPSAITTPLNQILAIPQGAVPSRVEVFRQMGNYGKIRGASDHMAVFADL